MELGKKIKQLRYKANWTQEQLAERLCVSAQAVSKWETAVSLPDISLLPALAEAFGVSIDEMFDLTREQKLNRIQSRLDMEEELPSDVFREYADFLQEAYAQGDDPRIAELLAQLYHLRMEADARRVSRYAREAIGRDPSRKGCQWLLSMAEGATVWDWNMANHAKVIDFYLELVKKHPADSPLPYYDLLDNLIADHRVDEAEYWLDALRKVPGHKPFLITVFRAHIALARFHEAEADAIMEDGKRCYAQDSGFLFELAQYHARKCEYDQAVTYYEESYALESESKPRFTDALHGIALIHEITGQYAKAAAVYDRILDNLHNEWGFTDEAVTREAEREKARLLMRSEKG